MRDDPRRPRLRRHSDGRHAAEAAGRPHPPFGHGSQYRSLVFGKLLADSFLLASMGSRCAAYYNVAMESFMASLKTQLINRRRFKTKDEGHLIVGSSPHPGVLQSARTAQETRPRRALLPMRKMLATARLQAEAA